MTTRVALVLLLAIGCAAPPEGGDPVTETETVPGAIHSAGESPIHGPIHIKDYWNHPCRKRILSRVWFCFSQTGAEVHTVRCPIPDNSFVAVGGGAFLIGAEDFPGAFIIDQRIPDLSAKNAWIASSKSHVLSDPHLLGVYVIGLKIEGVSRDHLASNIQSHFSSGSKTNHPSAVVSIPSDRILLSGGVFVPWIQGVTPGQLLVGSWGSHAAALWQVQSKDHIQADPMTISVTAYSIPRSIGGVNLKGIDVATSVSVNSGQAQAQVQAVGALTGIGAWATFSGEGRMLHRVGPTSHDFSDRGIVVQSKDHRTSAGGTTFVNALGLLEDVPVVRCPAPAGEP